MSDLPESLAAIFIAGLVSSASWAQPPAYRAPSGVTFLLRDQAIGCYRAYSFSTSSALGDVAAYYDRQARKAGLNRSGVQRRSGFYFTTYQNTSGFSLSVAVNAQSKPTTATIMYRAGNKPPRC